MPSTAESIITSNLTIYSGHLNLRFYRDCERQQHKIALHVKNFDYFRKGEKFNGEQRKYVTGGTERSGILHSIKPVLLRAAGINAFDYKWPQTPRYFQGDCHDELSSSGAKKEGLSRLWAASKNGALLSLITSDVTSPAAEVVRGQEKGIYINWEEVDRRYPEGSHDELEGFRPGKNFDSKIDFHKTFPWVENTEDLIIDLSGRKKSLGGLSESTGTAIAGNLSEYFGDWLNKLTTITYQKCKSRLNEKHILSEFYNLLDRNVRELRGSFSCMLDQKDKLVTMCDDTYDKELILFGGTGTDSGRKAQASQMRGGHAGVEEVIHIDSENEPWVRTKINCLSPEYIRKNVRAIILSESLETHSKELTEYLQSKGVITYGFTANEKSKTVQEHPERWIVIPNQSVEVIESPKAVPPVNLINPKEPPRATVSSFNYCVLAGADCVTSYWVVKSDSTVSKRHKKGE
jgi:hypothetical protein